MSKECVIFATLGPNPAPLTELVWKLARSSRFDHFEIHVVVDKRALHYLEREVLAAGGALEQLRALFGPDAIAPLVITPALTESTGLLEDDADPVALKVYGETVWSAARRAVESAGSRPVVFGLIAGRRRTMTALESSVFQLLARPQDFLVDVRVTDPRVEGGTGFFFPEQELSQVKAKHSDEVVEVADVDVVLVEVDLPRLGAFVPNAALETLEEAQNASKSALADAAPPKLVLNLSDGFAAADDEPIPLSASQFSWYSFLASQRVAGTPWTPVRDVAAFRAFLSSVSAQVWWAKIPAGTVLAKVAQGDDDDDNDLGTLRSKTTGSLSMFCRDRRAALLQLVPEKDKWLVDGAMATFQRLPLDPSFIHIDGP